MSRKMIRFSPQALVLVFLTAADPALPQPEPKAVAIYNDTAHTNTVTSPSFRRPVQRKWMREFSDQGQIRHPLIADGRIFVLTQFYSNTSTLHALDQATGNTLWETTVPTKQSWSSMVYEGGLVLVITDSGYVAAYDGATGTRRWAITNWTYAHNVFPTARNGTLYIATNGPSGNGFLHAINANDGTWRWFREVWRGFRSSPAVTDEGVYLFYEDANRYKFDPSTGATIWSRENRGALADWGATPVVRDGVVNVFGKYDAVTGAPISSVTGFYAGMAFGPESDGYARHISTSLDTVAAVYPPTGGFWWRYVSRDYWRGMVVINGNVYAINREGAGPKWHLHVLDGMTGDRLMLEEMQLPLTWLDSWNLAAGEGLLVVPLGNRLYCYASTVYTLSDPPATVNLGATVGTNWLVPGGRPRADWVGLFRKGTPNTSWLAYRYTNGATSGTATFPVPAEPGEYEFRYLLNDSYSSAATSTTFTVAPLNITLSASPSTGLPGVTPLRVDFTAPAGRPAADWIGLYKAGTSNSAYLGYQYANGATSGSFTFPAPAEAGEFEFRYLLNGGYHSVATSNRVTLTALNPSDFTLSAAPSTVSPGGALSVSFTAPAGRNARDWIGLYRIGADNRSYLWWRYTAGAESGTFNLAAPTESGQYEFRYLLEDGYSSIKTSNTVTVQ